MAELQPIGQRSVPFRGLRSATGPLTMGQRDTLSWVANGDDHLAALLFWRLRLPDGVRVADVTAALGVLLNRHEALRTNFIDVNGDQPCQRVLDSGELLVGLLRVGADWTAGAAEPAVSELTDVEDALVAWLRVTDIDLAAELPIRAAIAVTEDDVPVAAALLCSHAAADLGSLAVLGAEFNELVALSMAGTPLPSPDSADESGRHQPLDQAEFERTRTSLRRNESAIRYWAEQLTSSSPAMYPVPGPVQPRAQHMSGFLNSVAGGGALARIADRIGAGRQNVLLAAVCSVLATRTGIRAAVFAVLCGNRFRQRLHGYVGALAQDSLLSFEVGDGDFDDVVRRVGAATLTANTHGMYDSADLARMMNEIGTVRGMAFNRDFSFNNVSEFMGVETGTSDSDVALDEPADLVAALADSKISWLEWEDFPEMLMCHPVSLGRELVFALTANLRHVGQDELELLLRGVERLLVAAADGPVPLSRCGEITGVAPVVRDADWVYVNACWARLSLVRQLVLDAVGVPAAHVVVDERGLVAYLPAAVDTAESAHAACMAILWNRYKTMTPGYYVLCAGVPDDPTDTAAWEKLAVVAEGSGRAGGV